MRGIWVYNVYHNKGGGDLLNSSDILRGFSDTIILAQLELADSYGYEIAKNVRTITQQKLELKEATLYTTFRRLEQAGYIISYWGDENSGARRRYYSITASGKQFLSENRSDWEDLKNQINLLFGRCEL